jgi:hypothetical protein
MFMLGVEVAATELLTDTGGGSSAAPSECIAGKQVIDSRAACSPSSNEQTKQIIE